MHAADLLNTDNRISHQLYQLLRLPFSLNNTKKTVKCCHSVTVTTFTKVQSDPIKRSHSKNKASNILQMEHYKC
jgi:hypothetical protein